MISCSSVFVDQRKAKYSENKLKALKARNEYLLTLEATNASVFKYYIHDLPDIIDVSERYLRRQEVFKIKVSICPGLSMINKDWEENLF